MEAIYLLAFSVLLSQAQQAIPAAPPVTSFRAVVDMVSGDSRIFSGESVRLRCSILDVRSFWSYMWFRGSQQIPHFGENLYLWHMKVQEGGAFSCQGVRDSAVGNIYTLQSLPLEVNVDGGFAILQVPTQHNLITENLQVTCRVRGKPQLHEVILYKDGLEVMRQTGSNPHFNLTNLALTDQGMYSCRASWDADRRTRSVISAPVSVQVSDVLSLPVLEIVADNVLLLLKRMKLICHIRYNAYDPAPPIHFYFYKNNNRVGPATSESFALVKRAPGHYTCKARVPVLGVSRWSKPTTFGQVKGTKMVMPPPLHPSGSRPLAPPNSTPDFLLPPGAEPTVASPQQSSATPTLTHPPEVSIQSSKYTIKTLQPVPSTLLPTDPSLKQAAAPIDISENSGDMSGESGDMSDDLV